MANSLMLLKTSKINGSTYLINHQPGPKKFMILERDQFVINFHFYWSKVLPEIFCGTMKLRFHISEDLITGSEITPNY